MANPNQPNGWHQVRFVGLDGIHLIMGGPCFPASCRDSTTRWMALFAISPGATRDVRGMHKFYHGPARPSINGPVPFSERLPTMSAAYTVISDDWNLEKLGDRATHRLNEFRNICKLLVREHLPEFVSRQIVPTNVSGKVEP